jgi:Tol biopolymer transport system component/predicted Ser/Thr protein kinase
MGEVYKAKDTRLERTVAIKVLPTHLSSSEEVRQRFEREARTISSLSHPHICALYDVGNQDGVEYLVMEYLEGETLAERLLKGGLPAEQVLRYGIEMADALDKAHRQGIVHRDLKPGNVMLTKSGVKLLDFGLAKAVAPVTQQSGLTSLPTMAHAQNLTQEGTILGTFQYMAPEQLEGKEADARTDIFAFGAVLYEMATGRKAFSGTSQASLIGAILRDDPPAVSQVAPMAPPALNRVVKACLAKDPEERFGTAHDVRLQLQWIAEGGSQAGLPAPAVSGRRGRGTLPWVVAAVAVLAAAVIGISSLLRPANVERTIRLSLAPPAKTPFELVEYVMVSPDGQRVAFVARAPGGKPQLWIRPLGTLAAQPLSGTETADRPFWSPDSRFLGFFADGKLKKIEASGGPPQVLCDAPAPFGGAWSSDGVIVFAPRELDALYRVAATGGTPAVVTKLSPREEAHRFPSFLPDGRRFLFLADSWRTEDHTIRIGSLDSLESEVLMQAVSNPVFAPPSHIFFVRGGSLLAQRFDGKQRKLVGEPAAVGEQIAGINTNHYFDYSVSATGVLVYRTENPEQRLVWIDREGRRLGTVGESARFSDIDLSPDGERLVYGGIDPDGRPGNLWIVDLSRGTTSRLTSGSASEFDPIWSPDGRRIFFSSMRSGQGDLYERPSSPSGADQLVLQTPDQKWPVSWSSDGRLLFENLSPKTKDDLWILPASGDRKPVPVLQSTFREQYGQFSPDGRWIAYVSDESGRDEVYVQSSTDAALRMQVSSGGGWRPRWRGDGQELFYLGGGKLLSVEVKTVPALQTGAPKELFRAPPGVDYAVARDGQRFLFAAGVDEAPAPPTVVLHWNASTGK